MTFDRQNPAHLEALDLFIATRMQQPFAWGTQDCCTFAADWVLQATGHDPMATLRGLDSALAANRALDSLGGMLAAWDAHMPEPHIPGPFCTAGDLAMVTLANGHKAMAVCTGSHLAAPATDGILMMGVEFAEATWRVG